MTTEFMGHNMSDGNQICADCGMSRHQIVVQGVECSAKVETEDSHEAEEKFEMERDN